MHETAEQLPQILETQEQIFIAETFEQPCAIDTEVPDTFPEAWNDQPEAPLVMAVPEMAEDAERRQRAAEFIGQVLMGEVVEDQNTNHEAHLTIQPKESLFDAMNKAAEGDPESRRMVRTNVNTDMMERTIKAGNVNSVELMMDAADRIQQHGQSMESVQANSLRLAASSEKMLERTKAETNNSFAINDYYRDGTLNDYNLVVFSRAADNMSNEEMEEVGFFTDTMTCMIQVTSANENGLTTESASVAGARIKGAERHDAEMVTAIANELGHDLSNKTATETLDTPILVHKSLMPNGVIDLVKIGDEATGTFFGQDKPKQDYQEYLEVCREREERFQPKVDEITDKLIDNASKVHDRVEATEMLHKLSEETMVEQAVGDTDIDPLVFGEKAAVHIENARQQLAMGNNEQVLQLVTQAKRTAQSSSCPSAMKKRMNENGELVDEKQNESADQDCEFISKQCPECGERNVKTKVTKRKITGSCGCSVSK